MSEVIPLSEYKAVIWRRLQELSKMNFPQYRTYKNPDGSWTEREPVPEYIEQTRLCQIFHEIMAYENWFCCCHNRLLVSLRLEILANTQQDMPAPMDLNLLFRIAASVYRNAPVCIQ